MDESSGGLVSLAEARTLGLKKYRTGKPCKQGHYAERLTSNKTCMECNRLAACAFRAAHPEKHRENLRKFYEENKDARAAYGRRYRDNNITQLKARDRRYRGANAEKIREWRRQYYEANAEKICERCRQSREANLADRRAYDHRYYGANKALRAAQSRNYRALKRNAPGSHTAADIQFLYLIQNNCCAACDKSFDKIKAHVDHIVALAKGGSNDASNLQLLCGSCNTSKGAKDWDAWLLSRMLQTKHEAL